MNTNEHFHIPNYQFNHAWEYQLLTNASFNTITCYNNVLQQALGNKEKQNKKTG